MQRGWKKLIKLLINVLLAISDEDKMAWTSYHEKRFNTDFAWDNNSLSQADTVSSVPRLTDKNMVRESISKTKNRKAARPSGVVLEIVKVAGEL